MSGSTGFGLASVKKEGYEVNFDGGESIKVFNLKGGFVEVACPDTGEPLKVRYVEKDLGFLAEYVNRIEKRIRGYF